MNKSDAFYLGYISRKHGYKGALNIKLDVSTFKELKELDFLFIDLNKSLVPFFIEELSFKNNNFIIVKLEDINDEFGVSPTTTTISAPDPRDRGGSDSDGNGGGGGGRRQCQD